MHVKFLQLQLNLDWGVVSTHMPPSSESNTLLSVITTLDCLLRLIGDTDYDHKKKQVSVLAS